MQALWESNREDSALLRKGVLSLAIHAKPR
jgi:hypothetical protein